MLWIGSGRFDGRIGDGNGQRTCGAPDAGIGPSAQADGTVRQLAWGTQVVKLTSSTVASSTVTSGAVDRECRFDGRIGDGDGSRACRGPDAGIEADGKVRPGVPGW